ncbi:ABC transporter substrate-binding protein [Streptomyces sp. NPDC020681]|uniref:peptide ABC transporter substrate-binding protein n=1 Tax=Streptomyces sp. NPDC020681 TaxID=3365083 RepID=UPI003789FC99
MTRRSSTWKTVSVGISLVLALSACAGGGEDGSTGKDKKSGGGGFSFAVGEPDHLTPGRSQVAMDQMHAMFAPLVRIDDKGELSYVQAQSVTSSDSVHWTVKLRAGWTFHNGEPVTAQSYADAWNHAAYAPNAWANNGQLAGIAGYEALNPAKGKPKTKTLSGVRVVDGTTLEVTLSTPDSQFPVQLTADQGAFYPMPKAAFKDLKAYDKNPIGNGPFRMNSAWETGKGATVTAYQGYKGTKPAASEITFKAYKDMQTAYTDALAGNTDIVAVPASKLGNAKADFGKRLHTYDAPALEFLGLPLYDKRYQDVRLRKALSRAIDRTAVNKAMYGGLYSPATSFTPASEVGAPTGICDDCVYDPAAAKRLLAEAGGWSGPMELWYPGGLGLDELYKAVANQLRQNLGIEGAKPRPTADWAEYSDALYGKKVTGPHFGHWGALYPSMQNTLRAIFTEKGGCYVCSYYSHPEVDALLLKADSEPDQSASQELYVDAQKRILADFPVIPLFYGAYVYATSDRVSGVKISQSNVELDRVTVR